VCRAPRSARPHSVRACRRLHRCARRCHAPARALQRAAARMAALGREIERGARALAWLDAREFVTPEDVQAIAPDAFRHRLLLDYTAQARGVSAQACIEELLSRVPAP